MKLRRAGACQVPRARLRITALRPFRAPLPIFPATGDGSEEASLALPVGAK